MRSIAISVLNLLLNLPAYILRVWNTFEDPNSAQAQQSLEVRQSIERKHFEVSTLQIHRSN